VSLALLVMLVAQPSPDSGYLTVRSNMPGVGLYLEGDYVGRTPLERYRVAAGEYNLSIISNDSLDNVYWHLRRGSIGRRLSSFWTLTAVNAGTHQVSISPGQVTEVFLDYGRVLNAPTESKLVACSGLTALFGLGMLAGWLLYVVISH
jgi:hypothetical protein